MSRSVELKVEAITDMANMQYAVRAFEKQLQDIYSKKEHFFDAPIGMETIKTFIKIAYNYEETIDSEEDFYGKGDCEKTMKRIYQLIVDCAICHIEYRLAAMEKVANKPMMRLIMISLAMCRDMLKKDSNRSKMNALQTLLLFPPDEAVINVLKNEEPQDTEKMFN